MNQNICRFNVNQSSNINCARFVCETSDCQESTTAADLSTLGIVLKGSGSITRNQITRPICEGQFYFIRKGDTFSVSRGAEMVYSYISFDGRRADELLGRLGFLSDEFVFSTDSDLTDFWLNSLKKTTDDNIDIISEAVLLYTFAHFKSNPKQSSDIVTQMIVYTNSNFSKPSLSLSQLSEALKYNTKYLSFRFKKEMGMSYSEYLRIARIKHATFLLEQGVESVKSASILSGFHDPLYFSRLFKKELGISPSEYIARLKKDSR